MNYIILAIVLVLYFFPDYTKHILLLSSLVIILAFRNKASLNARHIPWIDRYDALVEWMNAHGGAWPREMHHLDRRGSGMSEEDAEENRHAMWVRSQRVRGRAALMAEPIAREGASRAALLERLEGWVWRKVQQESWIDRYNALLAWMSAHGGAWPRYRGRQGGLSSMSEADAEEHRHAMWVGKQRRRGQTLLSQEEDEGISRAQMLESLSGWSWGDYKKESWMRRYDALVAWMSAHGGAWPRRRGWQGGLSGMSEADVEEHRLAKWMQEQRSERGRMQEIERTSEGDISREKLFERLLRPQPPAPLSRPLSSRPIDLSVDAIEKEDRMKRRRIEEEAENIMRGWVMEERRSGQ